MNRPSRMFTIGHSTQSIEAFLALLKQHGVTAVADVRSDPFSRYNPQFNRQALERSLGLSGIHYVFLGRELGARSQDPSCYIDGQVQFACLASTALFESGIERVMRGAEQYVIALMCAEKEPLECHRTLLVAQALVERGVDVAHILADGTVETHGHALERLLELTGLSQQDLFHSHEDLIAEALARQEKKVAYVDEALRARAERGLR